MSSKSNPIAFFHEEFKKETPRAAVIFGAAILDNALRDLLRAFLVPCPTAKDELLSPRGALGNFSTRIDVCFRLGLISKKFARDLHVIRDIRNTFAHDITGCTFDNQSVKDHCKHLVNSSKVREFFSDFVREFPEKPRAYFENTVSWMICHIETMKITSTQNLKESSLEFGYVYDVDVKKILKKLIKKCPPSTKSAKL